MEDFPKQTIFLHQSDDVETTRTPSDALSKIPIRFGLIGRSLTFNLLTISQMQLSTSVDHLILLQSSDIRRVIKYLLCRSWICISVLLMILDSSALHLGAQ